MRSGAVVRGFLVLVLAGGVALLGAGCDPADEDGHWTAGHAADSAVASLVVSSDYGVAVSFDPQDSGKRSSLPTIYNGDGEGDVDFSPSGRYAAIYGRSDPGPPPRSPSVLDLLTGRSTVIGMSERTCVGYAGLIFSSDSAGLVAGDCQRIKVFVADRDGWKLTGTYAVGGDEFLLSLTGRHEVLSATNDSLLIRDSGTGRVSFRTGLPKEIRGPLVANSVGVLDPAGHITVVTATGYVWRLDRRVPASPGVVARYTTCGAVSCTVRIAGRGTSRIAWTTDPISRHFTPLTLWTVAPEGGVVRQGRIVGGKTKDSLSFFIADRLLNKSGPLASPYLAA